MSNSTQKRRKILRDSPEPEMNEGSDGAEQDDEGGTLSQPADANPDLRGDDDVETSEHERETHTMEEEEDENSRSSDRPFNSQTTDVSMSQAVAHHEELDDIDCPVYLKAGFAKVHESLANMGIYKHDLPNDFVEDRYSLLTMGKEHEITMDSSSKCMQVVPRGDQSNYAQPYEGYYLVYIDRCNSMDLPVHIRKVLYFYHSLLTHIKANGITGYVIPVDNLSFRKKNNVTSKEAKSIVGIFEKSMDEEVSLATQQPPSGIGISSIVNFFNKRQGQMNGERKTERDPFTIRIVETGALYTSDGKQCNELFCGVVITPNKAFNLVGYIQDMFACPPKMPQLREKWAELLLCYKEIQMYELNKNSGINCDPAKYDNDLGGVGGVYSVLSLLTLPLRIAWILYSLKPAAVIDNLEVIGFPTLSYKNDGTMNPYEIYTHRYISEQAELHETFVHNLKVYYHSNKEEQPDLTFEMKNHGGWPLKMCDTSDGFPVYLRFGLFKFPIVMKYIPQRFVQDMNFESFTLNLGKLPPSVEKKNSDFKTYNPESGVSRMMPDSHMLTSTELATPLQILKTFYGPNAQPEDDFRDDKLIKWYEATRTHVQTMLGNGSMTPEDAMVQLMTHLESCMEQHRCFLDNDGYGSYHLQQCRKITKEVGETELSTVSLEGLQQFLLEEQVPESIRHDPFLSSSYMLMYQWFDYNQDARWNASNAETALEFMLASILYNLGSHHHSIIPFFQGVLIVSNRAHNEVLIDKHYFVDWRKFNTTGAGCIQERINAMLEQLGLKFRIMVSKNKLVFVNPNRNTDVALENESCVVTTNTTGMPEVQSRPSPLTKFQPQLMLELRGQGNLDSYIRLVFVRDRAARNIINTTVDPEKDNKRVTANKEQVHNPNYCGLCTNQKKGTDEPKTIICVTHVVDPGAPMYKPITEQSAEINRIKCDLNDGRFKMPTGDRLLLLLKSIFFSYVFTKVDVAMLHLSGAFPYAMGFPVNASLDWLHMVVKEHLFCIFNPMMIDNYGRIKQGYENRHIGWSVWVRSFLSLCNSEEDLHKAAKQATMLSVYDALPVAESVSVLHSVLRRCIDGGWLSMLGCFIQALHVPIVPVEDLCDFYKSTEIMDPVCEVDEGKIDLGLDPEDCEAGDVSAWGDEAERDQPTLSSVVVVQPPLTPPPVQRAEEADLRVQTLEAKLRDCEHSLTRFGMLLDQTAGRLDDQLYQLVGQQKREARSHHEMRGVIQALVHEVGLDKVNARLQANAAQPGGGQPPGGCFSHRGRQQQEHQEQWKYQQRGGRRGRGRG